MACPAGGVRAAWRGPRRAGGGPACQPRVVRGRKCGS